MESEDKFSSQAKRVLERAQKRLDAAQDAAEAITNQLKKAHKQMLKDEDVREAVSQEMLQGVRGQTPSSVLLDKMTNRKINTTGVNSPDLETFGNVDNTPTGMERKYWADGEDEE